MLVRLDLQNLFGFEEPEPAPREEWHPERNADRISSMQMEQGRELLDVVRGMDGKPISKSGSFFDIPLSDGVKAQGRCAGSGPVEDDEESDESG
jgi:hypothetical protein